MFYDLYCPQIPPLIIDPGWWTFPSGATLTARTPSASPTRSLRWPSIRSQPSPSRLREEGGETEIFNDDNQKVINKSWLLNMSDMTASSRDSEVSPSPSWGRRPRPPRSWSWGWSAPAASGRTRYMQFPRPNFQVMYNFSSPEFNVDDLNLMCWSCNNEVNQFWLQVIDCVYF